MKCSVKQWEQALAVVESHAFSAEANIASDRTIFLAVLRTMAAVQVLASELVRVQTHRVEELSLRCRQLIVAPVDLQYENPGDVAVATYLWLLSQAALGSAQTLSQDVTNVPRNWWWARRVAELVVLLEDAKDGHPTPRRP